ncbi:Mu transposase C-terminal domain-containing protein [Rhizobium oryzicola]|uniref:Mu transposase C-terminal domain-containing protein n=1 Tax=Rhizobium oryzicola TaxID=1232668 RepID=A0ABT8SZ32_9HYPH|nr:Mu transposase C-terminal domain-containing protein [Rhizobium oryzicola]MDO1583621.1 Mu transposase C-terminal domain-containing protein [Rhizobium oryzicola]
MLHDFQKTSHFPMPRVFHHAVVKMSHIDRYSDNNVDWVPVRVDSDGWRFRNEADGQQEVFKDHQEIYTRLSSGAASIRYKYNAPEAQKLRFIFGDKTFEDIGGKRRHLALFREGLIKRFDMERAALGRKPRWSKEIFEAKLRGWRNEILTEMLDLDASGPDCRADLMIEVNAFPTPSVKTFRRDYKRYHESGEQVLAIVHRHHGPGQHFRPTEEVEALAFAHRHALAYMTPTKPSMAKAYLDYGAALITENAGRERKLGKIKRGKFEGIIAKFDAFDKWDGRHGRASAIKHFSAAKRGISALSIGERIEIDFWNVDLMSLFVETGMWSILPPAYRAAIEGKRIWFVAAIDVATRYVLAFRASLNPNAVTAVAAIRMIMSDKRHISDFVGASTPWSGLVQPRDIFSDNGTEFANDHVEGVMRSAGITFNRPQAGKPQARPFIESLFHSIGPLLASWFEGRTFGSIAEKGDYKPEHRITLQVDELIKLFVFAVCDIYHNKPHSGLGGGTPHNAWVRAAQEHGIEFPNQNPQEMLQIFGVRHKRRISGYGITYMGVPYGNDELHRQRTKYGQMEFEIKVDPENLRHIAVRGDKGWFVVENLVGIDDTVSLYEWMEARRQLRRQHADEAEAGLEAMYNAINRLRAIGEAAALRANLTPRVLNAQHYDIIEAELFGAWEAVRTAGTSVLHEPFALPEDPLRNGTLADTRAVPDYHEARKRDARKKKPRTVEEDQASAADIDVDVDADIVPDSYYEEY